MSQPTSDLALPSSYANYLASSTYTAADVLAKILTVDGAGSTLDADKLDGINSAGFAKPSDAGLVGHWSMDGVPEWPDVTDTYFQDAWATVDGWTAGLGCTVSTSGGSLVITTTETTAFRIEKAIVSTKRTVRLKIKSTRPDVDYRLYPLGLGGGNLIQFTVGTGYTVIDLLFLADTTNVVIYCGAVGSIGDVVTIDWIYIGDGTYSTPLLDNSGNGNHGTIYGATPVYGVSGKALSFDGVNDYAQSAVFFDRSAFSFSAWVNLSATPGTYADVIAETGNVERLYIDSARKAGVSWDLVGGGTATLLSTSALQIGVWAHVAVIHTGTLAKVYINGVLDNTSAATSLFVLTANQAIILGKHYTSAGYLTGTIDEPRIYNRALSADEVMGLYLQKGGADSQKRAVTAVPNSLVMRDSTGYVNGVGPIPVTTAGAIGYRTAIDVASGGTLTMPAGSGTYAWVVLTYGATVNSVKVGQTAAAASPGGTASANCTVLVWRII